MTDVEMPFLAVKAGSSVLPGDELQLAVRLSQHGQKLMTRMRGSRPRKPRESTI